MIFFLPLEPRYDPISYVRQPINDCFIFEKLKCVCTDEKKLIQCMGDMALMPKLFKK